MLLLGVWICDQLPKLIYLVPLCLISLGNVAHLLEDLAYLHVVKFFLI
jgi:hypothetical protein